MDYIALHNGFFEHRKVRRLAKALNLSLFDAAGRMVKLWLSCASGLAEDGVVSDWDADDFAAAMGYTMDEVADLYQTPTRLLRAVYEAGWLDAANGYVVLHDWLDYQGKGLAAKLRGKDRHGGDAGRREYARITQIHHDARTHRCETYEEVYQTPSRPHNSGLARPHTTDQAGVYDPINQSNNQSINQSNNAINQSNNPVLKAQKPDEKKEGPLAPIVRKWMRNNGLEPTSQP